MDNKDSDNQILKINYARYHALMCRRLKFLVSLQDIDVGSNIIVFRYNASVDEDVSLQKFTEFWQKKFQEYGFEVAFDVKTRDFVLSVSNEVLNNYGAENAAQLMQMAVDLESKLDASIHQKSKEAISQMIPHTASDEAKGLPTQASRWANIGSNTRDESLQQKNKEALSQMQQAESDEEMAKRWQIQEFRGANIGSNTELTSAELKILGSKFAANSSQLQIDNIAYLLEQWKEYHPEDKDKTSLTAEEAKYLQLFLDEQKQNLARPIIASNCRGEANENADARPAILRRAVTA